MLGEPLDFSYDMRGVQRDALLRDAAGIFDALSGHLGVGKSHAKDGSAPGDATRLLLEDVAEFAGSPDVYRITDRAFLDKNRPLPVRFRELTERFEFYWLRFPIGLMPRRGWRFNRLEAKIEFNPGGDPSLRPKAWQILPDRKFQTQLKIDDRLEVSIDENFEFGAKAKAAGANAAVDVSSAAKLGLTIGPFEYRVTAEQINHSGTGLEWVFWRLDGAEFFEENRPELVVVAQVPRPAQEFKIEATLQVYRYLHLLGADFRDAVKELPEKLRSFFANGLPMLDQESYDLTSQLHA